MPNTTDTQHSPHENESAERQVLRQPLGPEIITKFLKLFNELGNIVKYIDVVTPDGDRRRITRHPKDKLLLTISYPDGSKDLDPCSPDTYKELYIFDGTLAEILEDSTDAGIERIKTNANLYNALPYCVRALGRIHNQLLLLLPKYLTSIGYWYFQIKLGTHPHQQLINSLKVNKSKETFRH